MLWADVGSGKTSISLTAFSELQKAGVAKRGLVMATVRICQLTWRQEAAKWSHTKHLRLEFLHGPNKDKLLADGMALLPGLGGVDLFLINYEGLPWLCGKYLGKGGLPFDTIIADELTKLKKSTGIRAKALRKATGRTARKWGLTGTPAPNGFLDLFGQFLWIDGGASLGQFYSHYRDNFFQPDFDGFNYKIQKDGEARIKERIKNIVYRLEYTDLPAIRDNDIFIELDRTSRKAYDTMRNDMLIQIDNALITAGNAAAVSAKLKQMANGAVYTAEIHGKAREWVIIHEAKIDALVELIESLQGQPLLIAYQYHHDLVRLQERLKKEFGWDAPYLGSGVSEKDAIRLQDEWNQNKLPVMLCQPQSVGHGLNFQEGGAGHLCWFSSDFNLETYGQFIGRIRRKGNTSERVVNHRLIVKDSIDELVFAALEDKDTTQVRLLQGLRQVLQGEPITRPAAPGNGTEDDMTLLRRLPAQGAIHAPAAVQPTQQRAAAPQPAQAPTPAPARVQPRGWGQQAAATQTTPQAAAIQTKLHPAPAAVEPEVEDEEVSLVDTAAAHIEAAMGMAIQSDADGDPATPPAPALTGEPEKPKATRQRRTAAPAAVEAAVEYQKSATTELPKVARPQPLAMSPGDEAEVTINFCGSPSAVARAMVTLLTSFAEATHDYS